METITSKQLVKDTLEFKNNYGRAPRQIWISPWATERYQADIDNIVANFDEDIKFLYPDVPSTPVKVGNPYEVGDSVDDWGCKFRNTQKGVHGEVKEPIIIDDEWEDAKNVRFPEEWLQYDVDKLNSILNNELKDKFNMIGYVPRPFERLQFLRGTENLYVDLMFPPKGMMEFIERLDDFYVRYLTKAAQTDVDALFFMDDWGSQISLLINPTLWKEIFKPLYRKYVDIAHKYGKKAFLHSDGHILHIIPELIDIGLDALNSQVFCMGFDKLKQYKGEITFWGEICRQQILPNGTPESIYASCKDFYDNLWQDGGVIAQCEFGPAAKPENVFAVYDSFNKISQK